MNCSKSIFIVCIICNIINIVSATFKYTLLLCFRDILNYQSSCQSYTSQVLKTDPKQMLLQGQATAVARPWLLVHTPLFNDGRVTFL